MFIAYPLKGIEIKVNYDNTNGIIIYNNIINISDIQKYLKSTNFIARMQIDSVYEAEKRRYEKQQDLISNCKNYVEELSEEEKDRIKESLLYNYLPVKDDNGGIYSIKFVSRTGDNPNRELNDGVDSFLWITNNLFLYSKRGKGIYLYNLDDGNVRRLIEGKDEFYLEEFKDGILKYDDSEIILE